MWELIVKIAGYSATPLLVLAYLPQVISLVKTKNAEGISLSFWFILDLSLLFLLILALDTFISTGSAGSLVAQGANITFALLNTVLVIRYKGKGVQRKSLLGLGDSI